VNLVYHSQHGRLRRREKTEQNLILRSSKSEAEVTKIRKLRSMYCTIEVLFLGGVVAEWLARSTRVRKDTGSNPAEAGHYVTTVGKLFTPTVPSRAEGRLNQLAPGTAVPL